MVEGRYTPPLTAASMMRFRDDVQLCFDADPGVHQVRSSSRVGISDMGTKRALVERLRQRVADR